MFLRHGNVLRTEHCLTDTVAINNSHYCEIWRGMLSECPVLDRACRNMSAAHELSRDVPRLVCAGVVHTVRPMPAYAGLIECGGDGALSRGT